MTGSSFTQPPSKAKEKLLATGYKADGKEVPGKYHIYPEQAAAGLWTNPVDLCKYIIETQLSYKGESAKVLSPEIIRLRLNPELEDAALGVFVSTRGVSKYFNHSGGNEGFSCYYTGTLDEGNGVVIMTNSDNGYLLYEEIINSIATVYNWEGFYQPQIKKVITVEPSILDKYVGKYNLDGTTDTMKKSDNDLLLNVFGNVFWNVYFTSDSDFFIREYRGFLRFQTDKDNKVSGFNFNGKTVKKIE